MCVCVCMCACTNASGCRSACLSLYVSVWHDWACMSQCGMTEPAHLSFCCLSVYLWHSRVCRGGAWSGCFDTNLVACCLKNTGLKISPRALAESKFLELFWHTLVKCLSRQWRVSQYCGGRLGVLAMRRSSCAHSSGFATSVETDENDKKGQHDRKKTDRTLNPTKI